MVAVRNVVVASLLSLFATAAHAVEFKGVVGVSVDFGGETLMSGTYTDGSSWSVKANGGVALYGGVVAVTGDFETQATLGYKFGGPQAQNGSVTFDTIPFELMEFYRADSIRAGLGLAYQMSPKLSVSIPGSLLNGTYNFNNALGTIVQIGWAPRKAPFSIDVRYTAISYKLANVANPRSISGNSVGLNLSAFF